MASFFDSLHSIFNFSKQEGASDPISPEWQAAIRSMNWVQHITLTYPEPYTQWSYPDTRDQFVKLLGEKKASFFYVFELGLGRQHPHFHFLVDMEFNEYDLSGKWYRMVGSQQPDHLKFGLHAVAVRPGTLERLLSYVSKEMELNRAEKAAISSRYGLKNLWGVGGPTLRDHHRIFLLILTQANLIDERSEYQKLLQKLTTVEKGLEEHQVGLTEQRINNLEKDKRVFTLIAYFVSQFFPEFEKGLLELLSPPEVKSGGDERLRLLYTYLLGLQPKLIFKALLYGMAELNSITSDDKYWSQARYFKRLFSYVASLNPRRYQKICAPDPEADLETFAVSVGVKLNALLARVLEPILTFDVDCSRDGGGTIRVYLKPEHLESNLSVLRGLFLRASFPMVVPPLAWDYERQPARNYAGAYLLNSKEKLLPMASGMEFISLVSPRSSTSYWLAMNHIASRPLALSHHYFLAYEQVFVQPLRPQKAEFLATIDQARRDKYKGKHQTAKALLKLEQSREGLNLLAHYEACLYQFKELGSKVFPIYEGANPLIYFPAHNDSRGRVYYASHLSPTPSKFVRASLLHPYAVPFNLSWFKAHAYKCYKKRRISFNEKQRLFDAELKPLLLSWNPGADSEFIRKSAEPELLLAAVLEYQRFRDFATSVDFDIEDSAQELEASKAYLSQFLVSVDATSSGNQILALLCGLSTYFTDLNLAEADFDDNPENFYLTVFRRFRSYVFSTGVTAPSDTEPTLHDRWLRFNLEETSFYGDPADLRQAQENFFLPLFKKALMAGVYGLTKDTFKKDVGRHFREQTDLFTRDSASYTRITEFFTDEIMDYCSSNVVTFQFLSFLKTILDCFRKAELRPRWTTPLGLVVEQGYQKQETRRLKPRLPSPEDGKKREETPVQKPVSVSMVLPALDWKQMKLSFTPNFIHSLDASVVLEFSASLAALPEFRAVSYILVHDMLMAPPGLMDSMASLLRRVNYELFCQTPFLQRFIDECARYIELNHKKGAKYGKPLAQRLRRECDEKLRCMRLGEDKDLYIAPDLVKAANMYI